jgi:hypothetical protein
MGGRRSCNGVVHDHELGARRADEPGERETFQTRPEDGHALSG